MSTSADRTYEEQNDSSLNQLYDKVKNLVSLIRGLVASLVTNICCPREESPMTYTVMPSRSERAFWPMLQSPLTILRPDLPTLGSVSPDPSSMLEATA